MRNASGVGVSSAPRLVLEIMLLRYVSNVVVPASASDEAPSNESKFRFLDPFLSAVGDVAMALSIVMSSLPLLLGSTIFRLSLSSFATLDPPSIQPAG